MSEDLFEEAPGCAPDRALDGWDSEWDQDWASPRCRTRDDAKELIGAAVGVPARGTAGAGTAFGAAGLDAPPRWIPPRGWTGEGEVFAAGFLHRDRWDDVPAGAGFAAGGFMDDLAAGPLLAALISEATATSGLTQAAVAATGTTGASPPDSISAPAEPIAGAGSYAGLNTWAAMYGHSETADRECHWYARPTAS